MAKKLRVILRDDEYHEIELMARAREISVAEWLQQAIDVARREESSGDLARKLAAVRRAAQYNLPTGEIDTMLAEIERGYVFRLRAD
ncbi:MAG: hypothetical protein WB729_11485 [Candidatus Sulfotelmatobacter sp.]